MSRPTPTDLPRQLGDAIAAALHALQAAGAAEPPLRVPRAAAAIAPRRLARAMPGPASGQPALAEVYQRCLQRYRAAEQAADAPTGAAGDSDDLGAVLSNFVAANLHALHGSLPPAEALPALARQLAGIVRASAAWHASPLRERQAFAEQLAILAVLVVDLAAIARSQGSDQLAVVQRRARGYLRQLLGLDPDLLTLDVSGLALRVAAPCGPVGRAPTLRDRALAA